MYVTGLVLQIGHSGVSIQVDRFVIHFLIFKTKHPLLTFMQHTNLSFYITVIQWITSCHKLCYDHTFRNTFDENK